MKKKGWIGHDIHKAARPEVAESGGLSLLAGMGAGLVILMFTHPDMFLSTAAMLGSVSLAALIGLIDDRLRLSSFKKILFSVVAALPMLALYLMPGIDAIPGTPWVPFLGMLRVTILYIPFIPGYLTVLMNANNMLEGYNGEGSGTSIVVLVALVAGAIITGSEEGLVLAVPVLAATVAFFLFNRFPAKVFPGDVGTLQLGMAMGCIAMIGKMELALIIAIIPHILNAFHVIRSVRGLRESSTIKVKDIELIEGDLIKASSKPEAPLTLPRLVVARKPLSEPALVKNIVLLTIASGFLSVLTSYLVHVTIAGIEHTAMVVFWFSLAVVGCVVILAAYPAIRGLVVVILVVYLGIIGLLVLIERLVLDIGPFNWLVAGILAIGGLALWYYLSMKYFTLITVKRPAKEESPGGKEGK